MKKLLSVAAAALFACSNLLAGGLVTNTNQSAAWVRLPARDASTSIDAVYFNPAGLMKLNNGLHFSLSNQSIFQNREVSNDYPYLNDPVYTGEVQALFFPSIYAVYKMDKLAFSLAFNPVGGGGGATYNRGLPSFEMSPADLVPALSPGATEYSVDAFFEGSSIFFGYQAGISYKINDMISVFGGVRYVTAKNTYNGYLRNIQLNYGGAWTPATAIFNNYSQQASTAATNMQPLVDAIGNLTFAQAEAATAIDATTRATLEGGLQAFGVPQAQIDAMTLQQAQATYSAYAAEYGATANLLADKEVDVEQSASGITPIIGVNFSPSEKLNIGLKYEFATELKFQNDTKQDILMAYSDVGEEITMFPDQHEFRGDMPAMLSAGIDYEIIPELRLSLGTHYYFDKGADYGKKINGVYVNNEEVIDNNYFEVAGGLEYDLTEKLLVSGGYLLAKTGVNEYYQSDMSYSLSSNTFGIGGAYKFNEKFMLNLGFGYTMYQEGDKTVNHEFVTGEILQPVESYKKDNMFIAIGIDMHFGN